MIHRRPLAHVAFVLGALMLLPGTLLLAGCSSDTEASSGRPGTLIIGLSAPEENERTSARVSAITDYLSERLDMDVEIQRVTNGSAVVEAIKADKIHVGYAGTFSYLVAREKAGVEPLVTRASLEGRPNYYRSCLITYPGSGIESIEDVKERAGELTLSWAYPTSTSGHLVPRHYLQEQGIPASAFKEVLIANDHAASLFTVISKKVDLAAVSYSTLQLFWQRGEIAKEDVQVVWRSEPITPGPIFVRRGLNENLKQQLQQAYVDMREEAPEAWEAVMGEWASDTKYIPIADSFYQPFREMANNIDALKFE